MTIKEKTQPIAKRDQLRTSSVADENLARKQMQLIKHLKITFTNSLFFLVFSYNDEAK